MRQIIVCDTGPLLHLSEASAVHLFEQTGDVLIPPAVAAEFKRNSPRRKLPDWVEIRQLSQSTSDMTSEWVDKEIVDSGEAEAIVDEMGYSFDAFPNPFEVSTMLSFRFDQSQHVTVKVYDLNGAEVARLFDGDVEGGITTRVEFNPGKAADGVFVARLETSHGEVLMKRLVVIR